MKSLTAAAAALALPFVLALGACSHGPLLGSSGPPVPIAAINASLAAPDRLETDVERDSLRHSAEVLAFTGVQPGDTVLDMGSLSGYMAWLFSGVVGPEGSVTAQNPPDWYQSFDTVPPAIDALMAARSNVSSSVTAFDNLEGASGSTDVVFMGLVYHDIAGMDVDRDAMNRQVYALLRPGGAYVITDHAAPAGSGLRYVRDRHRIDPAVVREEVEAAGFRYAGSLDVLANPDDDMSLSIFDPQVRGATSQFGMKFVKPEGR
jgi:predicted methyltransferase